MPSKGQKVTVKVGRGTAEAKVTKVFPDAGKFEIRLANGTILVRSIQSLVAAE